MKSRAARKWLDGVNVDHFYINRWVIIGLDGKEPEVESMDVKSLVDLGMQLHLSAP